MQATENIHLKTLRFSLWLLQPLNKNQKAQKGSRWTVKGHTGFVLHCEGLELKRLSLSHLLIMLQVTNFGRLGLWAYVLFFIPVIRLSLHLSHHLGSIRHFGFLCLSFSSWLQQGYTLQVLILQLVSPSHPLFPFPTPLLIFKLLGHPVPQSSTPFLFSLPC